MPEKEFKNRKDELKLLEALYQKGKPKLIILYGRRRVGKTELLKEFLKKHKGLYLLGRQESELGNLRKLSSDIAEYFNDPVLKINPFTSWDAVFSYISTKPRMPIVFDEFPYFVQSSKKVLSILQAYWDNIFSKKNSFIVLCGSSIQMMENLLGKKSPIYGRRTEQILLEPLKFSDACLFFKESMSIKEKIINYSILGGMPAYLLEFDFIKNLKYNLLNNLFKKNKFLYQEVLFTLREELKEPRNYFSILYSIAKGNTKIGEIVNDTGLEKSFVTKYLSVLIDLQIVERRVPITEVNLKKSRKGIYLIKDNFFKFWFKFVFENQEYIEQDKQESLTKWKILPELNAFVGRAFEDIVLSELSKKEKFKDYLFGRWWDKRKEIDIVGIDKQNKKLILGEIKFSELNEQKIKSIKNSLIEKAGCLNYKNYERFYMIVGLGSTYKEKEVEVLNFKDIL